MFRKLAAFILSLSLLGVTFSNTLLLLDYRINTGSYARYCINKYRPYLKCNGQCQLMKKLKAQEEKEKKNTESTTEISIVLFMTETAEPQTPDRSVAIPLYPLPRHEASMAGYNSPVFQPPRS